jgi:hypothetical protein
MKSKKTASLCNRSRRASGRITFCALLAVASATTLADSGRGSIRAQGRAPAQAQAGRGGQSHVEAAHGPAGHAPEQRGNAPQARHEQPEVRHEPEARHEAPEAHREVRPEPAHVEVRHDWDEHDEDARHFGGFGHGEPVRIYHRGERIHDLPARHFGFDWNHQHYFWDDTGVYYLQEPDGGYQVVQPPVGAVITALPEGTVAIPFGPTTYYYLDGDFYIAQPGGFAVVNPPPGIVVPTLPDGANQVVVNGTVVYQLNGFNYIPSLLNGVTAYTVTPA